PLIIRRSLSVWKQNWLLTQARSFAGTYSSQISGGSTTWLSQSNTGKFFRAGIWPSCRSADRLGSRHRLHLLFEPVQRAVGDAELFEVSHRVGEIVAPGAAAAFRLHDDRRDLVERQPAGVVRTDA